MTQEEKDLLLKDLSARLPYQPLCKKVDTEDDFCECDGLLGYSLRDLVNNKIIIKPYLRPMSSMTEEEHNEWFNYYHEIELKEAKSTGDYLKAAILGESASIDWLNKKMFDFRGLIDKDLAISTEEFNPYKD